jgi:hypothetical protein
VKKYCTIPQVYYYKEWENAIHKWESVAANEKYIPTI